MNANLPYDGYFDLQLHKPVVESMISTIATEGFSQAQHEHYSLIFPHVFDDLDAKRNTKMPSVSNQAVAIEALETMMGMLPMIRVTECNGIITISGIPTNLLTNYILKNWKTSRIANNILLKRGMRWFSFYSFYAIEIVYMLETLMSGKNVRTHMLREIVGVLKENTWLADIDRPVESIFDYSKLDQLTLTLLPNQMDYLKEYEEQTQRYDLTGYVLASPPGTGKALKNGTPVRTLTGWKAIDKLSVGELVYGRDGKPTKVTGVYHHRNVVLFNITFEDGRTITACEDHQWSIYNNSNRLITISTRELIERFYDSECAIPLCKPIRGRDVRLDTPIDYFLQNVDKFTELPLGYLNTSKVNRLQILDGLVDNDDAFYTNNLSMANDVLELARSLGYIAMHHTVDTGHMVSVIRNATKLSVKHITTASKGNATCISVDNADKLFITKDYIVTHNTLAGFAMSLVSGAETTIFVVPNNSVDKVWVDTLKTRFKKPKTYWSSHGTAPITGKEDYIICHYEALKTVLANVRKFGNRKVMVWLDESHNFNELTAARTRMFVELCQTVNLIASTWASGTPFKAIGKEAVPMLRCICAQFTPPVEESFVKIFGATKGAALDILGNRMGKVMFKVPKTDVVNNERYEFVQPVTFVGMQEYTLEAIGKQLVSFIQSREIFYRKNMPEYVASFNKIMEDVRPRIKDGAEMNKFSLYLAGTKKLHTNFQPIADRELVVECNIIEREIIYPKLSNLEKKELKRVASVYKYVSLTIRGEALGRILTRARIDCFKEMVPNANLKEIINTARKKTLIFTSYVEVADAIYKQLISDGFKPLIVYGDTNKNLSSIMNQFKSDPEANPIIATFDSLSTAVPVIEASTVIMFNAPFRDYIRDQAVSRADRLGQDGAVTIANVLLDTGEQENISTRSKDIMQWSKEQVDAIMQLDDANLTKLALEAYGFVIPSRLKLF